MKARQKKLAAQLGIDIWVARDAAAAAVSPAIAAVATVEAPAAVDVDYAAKRGRPRKDAVREPAPAPIAAPARPALDIPPIAVPQDWAGLRAMVKDCTRCKLCETRTQTVFGVGVENASLMVVGEGPGADEDAQGEPFVGRAGKLLDEMLKAIGRSRKDNVFIANVVKCRPPGNRDPEPVEAESCRPYLEQQIKLVKPKLIVALGRIAAQRLLNTDEPLARLRGPIHKYGPDATPLFITYHPAYLLRSPREKAKSWDDLKKVAQFLEGAGAP
jgi:DNA polymerase